MTLFAFRGAKSHEWTFCDPVTMERIITIPRANPVDAFTMGGIIRDAGLTVDEFKELL